MRINRLALVTALAFTLTLRTFHADEPARLLIHHISPAVSTIYVANSDGTGERPLPGVPALDYNAMFSPDGQWVTFTSERDGSADLYRVRADGSGLERLTTDSAYDDQAAWSPDGSRLTFVSSRGSGTTDIWTLDLAT